MQDIIIPEELIKEIAESEANFCRKVKNCDPREAVNRLILGYRNPYRSLENLTGREKLLCAKILEVGSGNGFFLCYAIKNNINIVGIEPGKTYGFHDRFFRAVKLLKLNGISRPDRFLFDASAESLPFENNMFDIVFSVAVLEHVQNLEAVMEESIRVLKPGGILWANVPNYNSIYEGHYDIFWLPYMRKRLAKVYVKKIFKRDSYLIDELNLTTPSMFKHYLNSSNTYGKMYLHGIGLSRYVFEIYNFCIKNNFNKSQNNFRFKKIIGSFLKNRCFCALIRVPDYILVKILQFLGLAITFDIVLYKRGTK